MTDDKTQPTESQQAAHQQLSDAVARGLNRWREQRIGDPVPFIVDAVVDSSDPLGGYLIHGGVVRLIQETDLEEHEGDSWGYKVWTEPDQ